MAIRLYPTHCMVIAGCRQPRRKGALSCEYCYSVRWGTYEPDNAKYGTKAWKARNAEVRNRDRVCQVDGCFAAAVIADHYPKSRRQLYAEGLKNLDDIKYLRGLCKSCHSKHTARENGAFGRSKTLSAAEREYERMKRQRGTDEHGNIL